ncbi:MAG: FKBP-type peptidyl-prolyl cis-trans isomerase [Solirubrobacteraceae bacterium]
MNYIRRATPTPSAAHFRLRSRALAALALLGAGLMIAGCGSSSETSTITIGNESKSDNSLITAVNPEIPKTPTSGPLATKPVIAPGKPPPPTKLETKELVVGTGAEAKNGSTVWVNYVGSLFKTGKEFDSSWKRNEPFLFVIGTGEVINGWDKGVIGMKVGGRRELIIPASEAYGSKGNEPIPPNEALIFVVDLLKVKA